MSSTKPSARELNEREKRASEWRAFRKNFLYSQRLLAQLLGVCRRTVQMIETGRVSPQVGTLRAFRDLRAKHERDQREAA
jgi:DNA-binding XRE family transcriptional regulator